MENSVGRWTCSAALIVSLFFIPWASPVSIAQSRQQQAPPCSATGALVQLPGISEASGLAVSRRVPGRLWTHNDSGQPVLVALDSKGTVAGRISVSGAKVEDWEAVAVGPCGTGSCVYIGDIGDNDAKRRSITIYRVPEPENVSGTAAVSDVFQAAYPDGAHDAEALLIAGGRLYIVTKGETGPVALYRFPAQLQSVTTMKLEQVGEVSLKADAASRITDGTVSPDDQWVVLRSRSALTFYRASDLLAGQWRAVSTVDVKRLREPQGEGVAFAADNTIFLTGEGGGKNRPGTFARFTCAPRG
jgi:hypothetical protein